jgi:hypothetical protein
VSDGERKRELDRQLGFAGGSDIIILVVVVVEWSELDVAQFR